MGFKENLLRSGLSQFSVHAQITYFVSLWISSYSYAGFVKKTTKRGNESLKRSSERARLSG